MYYDTVSKYINNDKLISNYCLITYEYVIVACLSTEIIAETMFFISQKELFKSKLPDNVYLSIINVSLALFIKTFPGYIARL